MKYLKNKFEQYQVDIFILIYQKIHLSTFSGGYYTGLINDMHRDYKNFQEKGTFLQMEYLNPLIEQTSISIDHFSDEKKLQAPITLNSLSIQCTLPSNYDELENLSPLEYLIKYTKPSINRQQIILKLIRKISRDTIIDIDDVKDIIYEYFNHYQTHENINELFQFLQIGLLDTFQLNEIIIICCYAERYFLYKLSKIEKILYKQSLQERIDFEFLKRKFDGLKLSENLKGLIETLERPINSELFYSFFQ